MSPGGVGRRAEPRLALRATTWPSRSTIWMSLSRRGNEGVAAPGALSWMWGGWLGFARAAAGSVWASSWTEWANSATTDREEDQRTPAAAAAVVRPTTT